MKNVIVLVTYMLMGFPLLSLTQNTQQTTEKKQQLVVVHSPEAQAYIMQHDIVFLQEYDKTNIVVNNPCKDEKFTLIWFSEDLMTYMHQDTLVIHEETSVCLLFVAKQLSDICLPGSDTVDEYVTICKRLPEDDICTMMASLMSDSVAYECPGYLRDYQQMK